MSKNIKSIELYMLMSPQHPELFNSSLIAKLRDPRLMPHTGFYLHL